MSIKNCSGLGIGPVYNGPCEDRGHLHPIGFPDGYIPSICTSGFMVDFFRLLDTWDLEDSMKLAGPAFLALQ